MEEKNLCDIIKDLLPLYCDGQASEESVKLIEKHIDKCAECKAVYEKMSAELSNPEYIQEDQELIDSMKKVKRRNRLMVFAGIVAAALVCTGISFLAFWGVVPVKSEEVSIEYSARTYMENGELWREIEFEYDLGEGKVLNVRTDDAGFEPEGQKKGAVMRLYSVFNIPFDDNGKYPEKYSYGFDTNGKFAEGDALVIEFSDKTVTYDLKEIAEKEGIQKKDA